jgi:hypothetical protein
VQDQFVGMFLEEWRDSEEYERRQEDIKMANMDWDEQEPMWARPVESPVSLPPPSPPRPDDGDDPWGGGSADMYYDKPGDSGDESDCRKVMREPGYVSVSLHVRFNNSVQVSLRLPKVDWENDYEQMCERELARQEHIATVTGRPWHEAAEGAVLPWHWTHDLGVHHSHPTHGYTQEARERMKAVNQRCIPPPQRDAYGPRASNPQGSEQFRRDRAVWYEEATGESLEGVSLTEQWIRTHKVSRAFRADTRAGRPKTDRWDDDDPRWDEF